MNCIFLFQVQWTKLPIFDQSAENDNRIWQQGLLQLEIH